jgi:hypothetical protein
MEERIEALEKAVKILSLRLADRTSSLQGEINRLNTIFEHNRKLNNQIVYALQTGDNQYLNQLLQDSHWKKMDNIEGKVKTGTAAYIQAVLDSPEFKEQLRKNIELYAETGEIRIAKVEDV